MRWILPLLVCAQAVSATPINLISVPLGGDTSGNVYYDARGYSFTTKINPLRVTRLGIRAAGGGSVGIWKEDGTLVASSSPPFQTTEGGYYWATLPEPIILEPYTTYRVASTGTTFVRWRQHSEDSVSTAVTINGIVNSGSGFAFPSNGPWTDVEFWPTTYTMLVGPNFTFEVLPYDTTPPVITLIGDNPQTVYRGTVFSDLGATVTDDFDATRTITGSGTVDTSSVGTYTLTYATQDEVGNVATPVTRTVNVVLNPTGDEDNDGLNNTEEANLGTNPYQRDTDSDGVNDLREVGDGTDPLDPASLKSLSKGLVAYYPFNGNTEDGSGNGRSFTPTPSFSIDRFGVASSSGSFIAANPIATAPLSLPSTGYSVSLWICLDVVPDYNGERLLMHGSWNLPERGFSIATWSQRQLALSWRTTTGTDDIITQPSVLKLGEWRQLTCVVEPAKASLYLDGKLVATKATQLSAVTAPLICGGDDGYYFDSGRVDETRIWARALTSEEVALLYANDLYFGFGLEGAATKSPFDPATATSWSAGGTEWTVDTSVAHDGVDSVKAQTTDGQSTYREYTVTGPAVVDFWWKVSSELGFDFFSYSLNGVQQQAISGEVDWTYRTLTLPAGDHTIRWTYSKDDSGAIGEDAGWLDDFAVYPATATLNVRDGATALDGTVTVDFGDADIGSSGFTKSLTFSNEGFVPLEVDLSLPQGSPFTFSGGKFTRKLFLARGSTASVAINVSTAASGPKTAQLTILAPDSTTTTPQVTLIGNVLGPVIGVSAAGMPLTSGQNVDLGLAPRTLQFTISNTGNVGDLLISGISVTGNFQITQRPEADCNGDGICDIIVASQGSTTFTVLAQGGTSGVQSGTVTITSNDTLSETFSFSVGSKSLFSIGQGIAADSVVTAGTGGASGWDFASTQLPDGSTGQALKTGATPNSGGSALEIVTETAGLVSWTWKVSTQENFDWLLCEVDGQEVAGISTKNGVWQTQVVNVPAGANVRWVYRKDASGSIGEDAGYLADVEFRSLAANQSFSQWAQTNGIYDPQQRMPKSGLQAMFGWLGGFGVDGENTDDFHKAWIITDSDTLPVATYRYPISKTADGTQQILFSSDMSAWTPRRVSQRILSEDGNRMIVEATAPSGTKGFFKVVGSGDTSMVWVQGGTLPPELGGFAVATFEIGRTEVTWAEWLRVRNWATSNGYTDLVGIGAGNRPNNPAREMSWYEAVKWCNARSEMEGRTPVYSVGGSTFRTGIVEPTINRLANGYRLPTEAEWEWAAIGGIRSQGYIYSGSDEIEAVAWYNGNNAGAVDDHYNGLGSWPVAQKLANELGIHDMSGNVWEWCEDQSWDTRRFRGGSFVDEALYSTITFYGFSAHPVDRGVSVGFRVARNAED